MTVPRTGTSALPVHVREAADDGEFDGYLAQCVHAFGKTPYDHGTLRAHGTAAVAVEQSGGNGPGPVRGGGLFLPFAQHFGGRPVPSGGVAWLAVAPWARGAGLARRLTAYGMDRLRHGHGAVMASAWTPAVGMYRKWGWESAAVASGYVLSPGELPPPAGGFETVPLEGGAAEREAAALQDGLAARWDGPLHRPPWWHGWKRRATPGSPLTLGVRRDGHGGDGALAGYVTFTMEPHEPWGLTAEVRDFWYDGLDAVPALLDAVTARSPQVRRIAFRRSVLPRPSPLQWALRQYTVEEQGWYPWVVTLLDVPAALEARGWAEQPHGRVGVEVVSPEGRTGSWTLTFEEGRMDVKPGGRCALRCSSGTLAAWYAGGLAMRVAHALGTASGDLRAAALLDTLTSGGTPWLPDSF